MRTKNRKSPIVHLDYMIFIEEIKPWPPSQSLRTIRSVLIHWEHGDRFSGFTNQVVHSADGRIEFNESFRLPVTLLKDMSIKTENQETFHKNCLEFNLYEPRSNKMVKGQLLGTAVIDLADYGIVKESLSINVAINCKRTYKNTAQPMLFLKIQPVKTREASMDRNSLPSEVNGEVAEFASFTTDDDVSAFLSEENAEDLNFVESHHNHHSDDIVSSVGTRRSNVPHNGEEEIAEENVKYIEDDRSSSSSQHDVQNQFLAGNRKLSSSKENIQVKRHYSNTDDGSNHRKTIQSATDLPRINLSRKDAKMSAKESRNHFPESRAKHLEHRIKMLEGELREAAAMEVSLYSVVAEHGSSMGKVHAPARRLSRLYLHACKQNSKLEAGIVAKSASSGLLLVAKACGNDVPRLSFWLSNTIVLRAIVRNSFRKSQLPVSVGPVNRKLGYMNGNKKSSELIWGLISSKGKQSPSLGSLNNWDDPLMFSAALERVEAWIFSRIIESIWWQTFTPHMQSGVEKTMRKYTKSEKRKLFRRTSSSANQEQGNFSLELWKRAFKDACERICPVRAAGHECGCLHALSRMIMEQCIARLDVSMFNAILRKSADEIPTDPVSDPISDPEVLPIQAGKSSFGSGVQLKNVIGNWSRWLTDLCGIDDGDCDDDGDSCKDKTSQANGVDDRRNSTSFKAFNLLNALSDLMMLPKDMLLDPTVRKEVCPKFPPALIRRVLNSFVPDEFCPEKIPGSVLEALNSEDPREAEEDCCINFPCPATPVDYMPPSVSSVAVILGGQSSLLKKSHTSDDELDELNSPLRSVIVDSFQSSCSSGNFDLISRRNVVRYELLKEVWMNSE